MHAAPTVTCRVIRRNRLDKASRVEGAAAKHPGLQEAAGRVQEHLDVLPPRKLRQPRVQFGGHDHRSRQVWVYLQAQNTSAWIWTLPLAGKRDCALERRYERVSCHQTEVSGQICKCCVS